MTRFLERMDPYPVLICFYRQPSSPIYEGPAVQVQQSIYLGEPMLIETLKQRVRTFFDRLLGRYRGALPFKGMVVERVRDLLLANLDTTKHQLEELFTPGGLYEHGVNFVRRFAKGNVKLPFYARLFVNPDKVIDEVCDHLLKNAPDYKATIGTLANS